MQQRFKPGFRHDFVGCGPSAKGSAPILAKPRCAAYREFYPRDGGGKCLNMSSTVFSSFLSFFSGFSDSTSAPEPRQISFFVRPSKMSTTSEPTGVSATVVVVIPSPNPRQNQPPPRPS